MWLVSEACWPGLGSGGGSQGGGNGGGGGGGALKMKNSYLTPQHSSSVHRQQFSLLNHIPTVLVELTKLLLILVI